MANKRTNVESTDALTKEVEQLRAEVRELRALLGQGGVGQAVGQKTAAANAARSIRSADLDAKVVAVMNEYLKRWRGEELADNELDQHHGFPHFHFRHIRPEIAATLNERGVPAPRGGKWTTRQVLRAMIRYAVRVTKD